MLLGADVHAEKKFKPAQRGGRESVSQTTRGISKGPVVHGMTAGACQFILQPANHIRTQLWLHASLHSTVSTETTPKLRQAHRRYALALSVGMPGHYRKYCVLKLMGQVPSVVSKRMYIVELVLCLQNEVLCWAPTAIFYFIIQFSD